MCAHFPLSYIHPICQTLLRMQHPRPPYARPGESRHDGCATGTLIDRFFKQVVTFITFHAFRARPNVLHPEGIA